MALPCYAVEIFNVDGQGLSNSIGSAAILVEKRIEYMDKKEL